MFNNFLPADPDQLKDILSFVKYAKEYDIDITSDNDDTMILDSLAKVSQMQKDNYYLDEFLKNHKIGEMTTGDGKHYYYTIVKDPTKYNNKRRIKRSNEEDLKTEIIRIMKESEESNTLLSWTLAALDFKFQGEDENSTPGNYKSYAKRFFKGLEHIPANELDEEELSLVLENHIRDLKLPVKAYGMFKTLLKCGLNWARRNKKTNIHFENLMDDIFISSRDLQHKHHELRELVFSDEEYYKLIDYLVLHLCAKNICLIVIAATGIRPGEAVALKHSDFDGPILSISKTQARKPRKDGKGYETYIRNEPKTPAGYRKIALPPDYDWLPGEIAKLNPDSEYIFLDETGKPMSTNNLNNQLHKICKKLGIDPKSPNKLRKTQATALKVYDFSDLEILSRLGHVDISTTFRSYINPYPDPTFGRQKLGQIPLFQKRPSFDQRKWS